jgi:predicted transcriptional regulator YdeE
METFKLFGKKLNKKTTNENGQSSLDCGAHWQQFEENRIAERIPYSETLFAVYFDYQENGYFSYFIGCKVALDAPMPQDLDELIVPQQSYYKEVAKGQMTACMKEAWNRINQNRLDRAYGYDFEVYDHRSQDWSNAEVDIYVSIGDNQKI